MTLIFNESIQMSLSNDRKNEKLQYAALACVFGLLATVCALAPYIGVMLLVGVVALVGVVLGSYSSGKLIAWLSEEDGFGFAVGAIAFGMLSSIALSFLLPQAFIGLAVLCGSLVVGPLLGGAIYKTFECINNLGEQAIQQYNTHSTTKLNSEPLPRENNAATRGTSFFPRNKDQSLDIIMTPGSDEKNAKTATL